MMSRVKDLFWIIFGVVLVRIVLPVSVFALSIAPPATLGDLNSVFASAVKALISLVGIASLTMLLFGGFKFISAGSDKEAAQKAQQTINYAVGGLIISLSAWLILSLIGNFLGVNLNVFDICITPGC